MSAKKLLSLLAVLVYALVLPLRSLAQVNLPTGSAVFSLPMFDWQDTHGRLKSTIALSYNSGNGLKVNDVASNVGTGWSMIAGGVITRMQVGQPDDQPAYTGNYPQWNDQDLTKYPAGYLYDTAPVAKGCSEALEKYPTYGSMNTLYSQHNAVAQDQQLDYFAFQFNGKTGMFILDTSHGWHAIPIGDTRLRITFVVDNTLKNFGVRTTITSFQITDVDGLIYKFIAHGLTRLLTAGFSSNDGIHPEQQPNIKNGGVYAQSAFDLGPTVSPWVNPNIANPWIINSWYLNEVDDPFTGRKIMYWYEIENLNNAAGADINYYNSDKQYVVVSYKKSITSNQRLDSITYPDGHGVKFRYASRVRYDLPGDTALSTVTFSYNGRYVSQYQLSTTYIALNRYGNPTTPYQKSVSRLYLKSVKKIGPDLKEDAPPYQFDYYTSSGTGSGDDFVPPPFFYVKDNWGYYNGNNSIASNSALSPGTGWTPVSLTTPLVALLPYYQLKGLCFRNDNVSGTYYNVKPLYAQNGLLKEIVYPTGGSLTYTYAQNTGSFIQSPSTVLNVGGVHVAQTSSADGGYSNGCSNPVITQYNYVMNGAGSASSLWGLETPVDSLNSTNSWKDEKSTIHVSWTLNFTCKWHYIYPGILNQYEAVSLTGFQQFMQDAAPVLGILSTVGTINDIINLCTVATFLTIAAVVIDVIVDIVTLIISCQQSTQFVATTCYYNYDLNNVAPLPVQFKRVEITEGSGSGTIGKTVQQFTHGDPTDPTADYPLWSAAGSNVSLSSQQRFAPWAYGLPKLTTTYDVNGNKITEIQNKYDFTYAKTPITDTPSGCTLTNLQSCKCMVINNYSQRADDWASVAKYNAPTNFLTASNADMNLLFYPVYTGHVNLDTTLERTYRTTDVTQFVQTETDYYYNNGSSGEYHNCAIIPNNFDLNKMVTHQSNGDLVYKNIYYAGDFYFVGLCDTLVQHNMFSVPVSTQDYVIKAGTQTPIYLGEHVTEFGRLSNNDIQPSRRLEQRFVSPTSSFTGYGGPSSTYTNYANYAIPVVYTYDANNNLTGNQDEGNRISTNIYDYNDKFVTAVVSNANPTVDHPAYTSFESQDLSRSGWTLTGSPQYNLNSPSATGSNNFTLLSSGANSLTAGSLNTATAYTLSFWATNANVTVTGGASQLKWAPTYNGYTYYEYSIAAGTSSVVLKNNASTSVNIDELRLYPVNARMRTTTFDPILGKTSECDENNRIVYYTYDNLGRLQFKEDEQHNVLRMYEYNNVSWIKQTGCPVTYYNKALSEQIARNNCTTGYLGDTVTYTVPAAEFSSTISQQDADFQAEIYLLTNIQTYANTNGTCSPIYYNILESQTDTTQGCALGYKGGLVTYTVAANTYSSIISQADANQQALNDIAANAQSYANLPGNANCVVDTAADWEWSPGDGEDPADPSYCLSVNGQLPPHLFVEAKDLNPNSPTYGHQQWFDYGPNNACPAGNYYNAQASQAFARNNCTSPAFGTTVTYTVPPGEYSSTTSQAAANQLATNDITANGQNYANANGSCVTCSISASSPFSTITTSITSTATTTTFTLGINSNGSTNWYSTNQVAVISGSYCVPSGTRQFFVTSNSPSGSVWSMTVTATGQITIQLSSGTVPSNVVIFENVSYNK
jgi:hypothetical protein